MFARNGSRMGDTPDARLIETAALGEEWQDISFAIGKTSILKNVTGIASPGRLTGVMGPSGSGKTTLLNVLSGRQRVSGYSRTGSNKQEVHFSGEVFARGRPVPTSFFRGKTAFVFQDNALMDSDTAREALQFSAYLRLSRNVSKAKRDQLVEMLLEDLHLEDSANVIVGGPLRKGLSGGQQKRVAVGVELISNPQMIFLDEPISGLDSYNAFTLMQSLNRLSRTGVPVVLTIHQPSSEIYDLIDDVIFLCKGEVVFQGPRWGLFSHFDQLGFKCPTNHNPADFVMFLIHKEGDDVLDQLISNWRTSTACKQLTSRILHAGDHFNPQANRAASRIMTCDSDSDSSEEDESSSGDEAGGTKVFGQPRKKRNCCQAQWALIRRDGRRIWRDKSVVLAANIQNLLVSLVYGWLFFGAGNQESRDLGFSTDLLTMPDVSMQAGKSPCLDETLFKEPLARDQCVRMFQVHWGALSIVAINAMMGSITWAITVFQNERSCFLREASSGYYTNFSYFFSKTLFEFPVMCLSVLVSIFAVYWLMALRANPFVLIAEVLLLSVASSSIVFCLSAQASTSEQAYALAPIAQIPQFAFAGILLPIQMVPESLQWVKWLCPLYYGMTMMTLSEFSDAVQDFHQCEEKLTVNGTLPSDTVMSAHCPGAVIQVRALQSQGVYPHYFWWPAFSMCVIFFVCFRLLSVAILWRKSRFVL